MIHLRRLRVASVDIIRHDRAGCDCALQAVRWLIEKNNIAKSNRSFGWRAEWKRSNRFLRLKRQSEFVYLHSGFALTKKKSTFMQPQTECVSMCVFLNKSWRAATLCKEFVLQDVIGSWNYRSTFMSTVPNLHTVRTLCGLRCVSSNGHERTGTVCRLDPSLSYLPHSSYHCRLYVHHYNDDRTRNSSYEDRKCSWSKCRQTLMSRFSLCFPPL